jgi:hypothetical protein
MYNMYDCTKRDLSHYNVIVTVCMYNMYDCTKRDLSHYNVIVTVYMYNMYDCLRLHYNVTGLS